MKSSVKAPLDCAETLLGADPDVNKAVFSPLCVGADPDMNSAAPSPPCSELSMLGADPEVNKAVSLPPCIPSSVTELSVVTFKSADIKFLQ